MRTRSALVWAVVAMVGGGGSATAERLRVRIGANSPYSECYCRSKGQLYPVGQSVCVSGADGPRMAVCGMEQNVTTWRFSKDACPET